MSAADRATSMRAEQPILDDIDSFLDGHSCDSAVVLVALDQERWLAVPMRADLNPRRAFSPLNEPEVVVVGG